MIEDDMWLYIFLPILIVVGVIGYLSGIIIIFWLIFIAFLFSSIITGLYLNKIDR